MIEVKNLRMSYGKREVLKDISFEVKKGEIVGLLGANGAGKSTTMNILTGYLKPGDGQVKINGVDMRKNPKQAKRYIGYLPEIPPLYSDMKVVEYLLFVADLKGVKNKKEEVDRVLSFVNMEERKDDFIKKLSKGLQQRVGFAQVLIGNPPVLVLDEPLVGLDPKESKRTRELIRSLREEHVIIISSHILTEIEELCSSVLMLKDGKVVLDGSTAAAKRRGSKNVYRLTVKGNKEDIMESLEQYGSVKEVQYLCEKEKGLHEFIVKARMSGDIRDSIFGYLVGKQYKVYGIEKEEMSLEDIFINVNDKEEK